MHVCDSWGSWHMNASIDANRKTSFWFEKEWSFLASLKDFSFFLVLFHCPVKQKTYMNENITQMDSDSQF